MPCPRCHCDAGRRLGVGERCAGELARLERPAPDPDFAGGQYLPGLKPARTDGRTGEQVHDEMRRWFRAQRAKGPDPDATRRPHHQGRLDIDALVSATTTPPQPGGGRRAG